MSTDKIGSRIRELTATTLCLQDMADEMDFFEAGASSLTITDMQMRLEAQLGVRVPTAALFAAPSIQGWTDLYRNATQTG